ncbi:MAG: right-handed parallel beta-helix repeat-containing protein [Armatimonadota bacterium]|nr:right-handed parallel beta-helix repeat-containing protein [Armatimonadota bacterium]
MTRRRFLKEVGVAAAGLGALAGVPSLALAQGGVTRVVPTPGPTATPAPTRTYRLTADLGVPGDGRTECSLLIGQAMQRVPAGSTVVCDARRYLINGTLGFVGLRDITLQGNGTTFFRTEGHGTPTRPRPYVYVDEYSNLTLLDFTVEGFETVWTYSYDTEFDGGFRIRSGNGLLIRNVFVHHVGGDGFQIQGRLDRTRAARNVTLDAVRVNYARRQGITLTNCDGVVVQGALITWTGRSAFDAEPYAPTWYSDRITVRRCRATHILNYFMAAAGEGRHDGMLLEDNECIGGLGLGVIGTNSVPATGVVVRNNRLHWSDPELVQRRNLGDLHIRASDAVSVTGNHLVFRSETSVDIWAPSGWVANNTFAGVNGGLRLIGGVRGSNNTVTRMSGAPAPIQVLGEPEMR